MPYSARPQEKLYLPDLLLFSNISFNSVISPLLTTSPLSTEKQGNKRKKRHTASQAQPGPLRNKQDHESNIAFSFFLLATSSYFFQFSSISSSLTCLAHLHRRTRLHHQCNVQLPACIKGWAKYAPIVPTVMIAYGRRTNSFQ